MRHRCGGTLVAGEVQVVFDESAGISLAYRVNGFICDQCHEQLIDRETAVQLQASQTPTMAWNPCRADDTRNDPMRFTVETPTGALV